MYEMLTGRLPFEGDTPLAVALQHINSVPLPPRDHVPDIPKTLEDIVMKAMAPQPADPLPQRHGYDPGYGEFPG